MSRSDGEVSLAIVKCSIIVKKMEAIGIQFNGDVKAPCPDCGIETAQLPGCGVRFRCDSCSEKVEREEREERNRKNDYQRRIHWEKICPEGYRATDPNHPGLDQDLLKFSRDWARTRGWESPTKPGLGLIGPTRLGKTRVAYLLLKHLADSGKSVWAVRAKVHARQAVTAAGGNSADKRSQSEARHALHQALNADITLIDDLGKISASPRAIEAFEDLIEHRTSLGLPLIWTANGSSKWLTSLFGPDSGPPIVARLAEFCRVFRADDTDS